MDLHCLDDLTNPEGETSTFLNGKKIQSNCCNFIFNFINFDIGQHQNWQKSSFFELTL
jgi:hypothetical protein